jgi:hypothetical protein
MSERIATQELIQVATVSNAPAKTKVDRNFGLPTGLYVATVGLYLTFLATLTAMFGNAELIIPMAIMMGFVVIAFSLAGKWSTMKPANDTKPLTWGQFSHRGIQTMTGPLSAGEASVQVLLLPVLIVFWGLCVATIAALT